MRPALLVIGSIQIVNVLGNPIKREIVYKDVTVFQTITFYATEIVNDIPTKAAYIVTDIATVSNTSTTKPATVLTTNPEAATATPMTFNNTNVTVAPLATSADGDVSRAVAATITSGNVTNTLAATVIETSGRTSNNSTWRHRHQHHNWNASKLENYEAPTSSVDQVVTAASVSFPSVSGVLTSASTILEAASASVQTAIRDLTITAPNVTVALTLTTSLINVAAPVVANTEGPSAPVTSTTSASTPLVVSTLTTALVNFETSAAPAVTNIEAPVAPVAFTTSALTPPTVVQLAATPVEPTTSISTPQADIHTSMNLAAASAPPVAPKINDVASPVVVFTTFSTITTEYAPTWTPPAPGAILPPVHPTTDAADGSPLSDGVSVLTTINKWRAIYDLPLLAWNRTLELNALKTGEDGHGVYQIHERFSGTQAQVIAPGGYVDYGGDLQGDTPFELSLMAWLCEFKDDPQLKSDGKDQCQILSDNMPIDFEAKTGHHEILVGQISKQFTMIGCGFTNDADFATNIAAQGLWICDLA